MFDANKVACQALLRTVWLKLRILQEHFKPKIGRKSVQIFRKTKN